MLRALVPALAVVATGCAALEQLRLFVQPPQFAEAENRPAEISFADIPGLADAIRRAIGRQPIDYRFDGTVGVDAGQYGRPEFGPMTVLRGTISGTDPPRRTLTWEWRLPAP